MVSPTPSMMAAVPPKPPDPTSGARRASQAISPPSAKSDNASQHAKKKARVMNLNQSAGLDDVINVAATAEEVTVEDVIIEDVTHENDLSGNFTDDFAEPMRTAEPNAWNQGTTKLFNRLYEWYVTDSDSEDVAESMREEDDMMDEEDDPLCPSILFTAAEKLCFRREWRSALIVKGLGRRIPYLLLARRLNSLWAKSGNLQISDLNNGCFLVRFRAKEDCEIAVTSGPWMLGEIYITVHRWHKGFNPWDSTITKTLVWIQLPEFYYPEAVMRITSKIGKPIRVDRATKEGARAKYARVCVEVDLTRLVLSKFKIEGIRYFIGYEGLNDLCTHCGKYGAPTNRCTCRSPPPVMDPMMDSNRNEIPTPEKETEATYGTWMIPRSRYQRRN
ncbi:hypothetical protein LINGRAHAP2_LOCUS31768 [Linum grandiflorum]